MSRRLRPEDEDSPEREDVPQNLNHPESDGAAVRGREDGSLSFRHFLQPHSDVVPQPQPTVRGRGAAARGMIDLVDVSLALPDFVQDHLTLDSLANVEPSQDMSPSRPHPHPVNLGASSDHLGGPLHGLGSSQRSGGSLGSNRNRISGGDDVASIPGSSSALPDFLSDSVANFSSSSCSGRSRRRPPDDNALLDEPVRGPSSESPITETLRSEIERLRNDLTEKNRRINELETELAQCRSSTSNPSALARAGSAQRNWEATNGSGDYYVSNAVAPATNSLNSAAILEIARSSEALLSQLQQQIADLRRSAEDRQPKGNKQHKDNDSASKPGSSRQ